MSPTPPSPSPLSPEALSLIQRYWSAANYLSVGQIYLLDNPLLREPLRPEHVKPRLLGHWGTTPGLNFVYVHLNRIIRSARPRHDLCLPAPAMAGRPWSPTPISKAPTARSIPTCHADEAEGLQQACSRQFSFPGGIPSHAAPETPGSIHEGGELGYALVARLSARPSTIPISIVACVVGDGEAETGPLAAAWHSNKFLEPGAVTAPCCRSCISTATRSPTRPILARMPDEELAQPCSSATATSRIFVEGDDPDTMHQQMAGDTRPRLRPHRRDPATGPQRRRR